MSSEQKKDKSNFWIGLVMGIILGYFFYLLRKGNKDEEEERALEDFS